MVEHIQHAAEKAADAEHTGERTQTPPYMAKQKFPAHGRWFLCVEPGTAALTDQDDGLLNGCSTVSVRQDVYVPPSLPARFSGVVKKVEPPTRQVVATFVARIPSALGRLQVQIRDIR